MFVYLYFSLLYVCTSKGKNITKITIKLMIPILQLQCRPISCKIGGSTVLCLTNVSPNSTSESMVLRWSVQDWGSKPALAHIMPPHLPYQWSNFALKLFTDSACTASLSRLFHSSTILFAK